MSYVTIPPALVSELVAAHPVTREELNGIRDPRAPSRFCGVYGHKHGGAGRFRPNVTRYRARVFKFFELSSGFETPEEAARAVVAFYKAHYGDRWRRAFRYRKVTPWRIRTVTRGTETGVVADVYLRGVPTRVTYADVFGRAKGASERDLFSSAAEAKIAARLAMAKWFEREKKMLTIPATGLMFWRG